MAPTWTKKMGKHFPVGEKSGNFEQTGKLREFYPKYSKGGGAGDFSQFLLLLFFSDFII